jgi:YjbE family integral membrane protein
MAASRLDPAQRRRAIIWGGAGAIGLRIFFTAIAALLLDIPLLQAIGAVLLLYIAVKLLRPVVADVHNISAANSFREALKTIIMADVIMSLDNILAVGGAAHGNLWLLLFGLLLSIPILLFASGLVARLIHQYPVLNYIGAGVLAVTALRMFFHDPIVHDILPFGREVQYGLIAAGTALVLAFGYWMNRRARQELIESATVSSSERARRRAEEHVAP